MDLDGDCADVLVLPRISARAWSWMVLLCGPSV